jgi:hypothetical protein
MKARNKRVNERNLEMKGIYEAMSRTPTKSIREEDWCRYQGLIVRHYEKLWSFGATKKRRKDDFRIQGLKEKCLDGFFNKFLIKGEEKPVIAYGGVTMGPTGRGELSVPVKYVYQKCEERFHTKKVDERYTTKMHFKCKGVTEEVEVDSKKQRGLRWCSTCSELVSRDGNACLNIACIYKELVRPTYLGNTYERQERRKRSLKGCNYSQSKITECKRRKEEEEKKEEKRSKRREGTRVERLGIRNIMILREQ